MGQISGGLGHSGCQAGSEAQPVLVVLTWAVGPQRWRGAAGADESRDLTWAVWDPDDGRRMKTLPEMGVSPREVEPQQWRGAAAEHTGTL